MRRILSLLTAVSLLGASWGCRHIAGACDCGAPCSYGTPHPYVIATPPAGAPAPGPGAAAPEVLKPMPKEVPPPPPPPEK